jgi:excisionase family DNA binding protein
MFENYNEVLKPEEVCTMLHIGKNTLYNLLNSGQLVGYRVGKRNWRINKTEVIKFVLNAGSTANIGGGST